MASRAKRSRNTIRILFLILLVAGGFVLFKVFGPNTGDLRAGEFLFISTGSTYDQVKQNLSEKGFVKDMWSFDLLAQQAGYPVKVKAGKYHIRRGMSNYNMVRMLRSGSQTPVKLVIRKLRTKQDFVRLVAANLEADSVQLSGLLNDSAFLERYGLDTNSALCAVIPDTYEFWWNTSANNAFSKLAGYYQKYWTAEKREKARSKNLRPEQIVTLASIIEEETNYDPEKPLIASVYLNRLRIGMRLQADPTVKFAIGDFSIRRINSAMTRYASPYNTYYAAGLPPGPICTPSKKTIEAVLNAPKTSYIYFSAKEDFSGAHHFASSYGDHLKNAALYQKALNERGIH